MPSELNEIGSVMSAPGVPLPVLSVVAPSEMAYETLPERLPPLLLFDGSLKETVPVRSWPGKLADRPVAAAGVPSTTVLGTVRSMMEFWLVNSPTSSAAPVARLTVYSLEAPFTSTAAQ